MTVKVFGAVSSPTSCNFVLQQLAKENWEHYGEVADKVKSRFNVENYLDSFDCKESAEKGCRAMSSLLMKGGFRLTKWTASSTELLARLKQGSPNTIHDFEVDPQATPKTLGLLWNRVTGQFFFRTNPETTSTKRSILIIITKNTRSLRFSVSNFLNCQDHSIRSLEGRVGMGQYRTCRYS